MSFIGYFNEQIALSKKQAITAIVETDRIMQKLEISQ